MLLGRWGVPVACGAILVTLLLSGCDMSSNPAAPTPVPMDSPVPNTIPNNVAQVVASPTRSQSSPTAATTDTPFIRPTTVPHHPLPPTPYPYPTYRSTEGYTSIGKWPAIAFSAPVFNYLNEWRRIGINDKYELRVYAGGEGQDLPGGDPEQGALVLMTTTWPSPLPLVSVRRSRGL